MVSFCHKGHFDTKRKKSWQSIKIFLSYRPLGSQELAYGDGMVLFFDKDMEKKTSFNSFKNFCAKSEKKSFKKISFPYDKGIFNNQSQMFT